MKNYDFVFALLLLHVIAYSMEDKNGFKVPECSSVRKIGKQLAPKIKLIAQIQKYFWGPLTETEEFHTALAYRVRKEMIDEKVIELYTQRKLKMPYFERYRNQQQEIRCSYCPKNGAPLYNVLFTDEYLQKDPQYKRYLLMSQEEKNEELETRSRNYGGDSEYYHQRYHIAVLVAAGADANCIDSKSNKTLDSIVLYQDFALTFLYLQKGADPNKKLRGSYPLFYCKSKWMVQLLLAFGASLYNTESQNYTVLEKLAFGGNSEHIPELIQYMLSIDQVLLAGLSLDTKDSGDFTAEQKAYHYLSSESISLYSKHSKERLDYFLEALKQERLRRQLQAAWKTFVLCIAFRMRDDGSKEQYWLLPQELIFMIKKWIFALPHETKKPSV